MLLTKQIFLLIVIFFSIFSHPGISQPDRDDQPEILALLRAQSEAWNAGDIEKFMLTYWNDDSLVFLGKTGPVFGYEATLQNYYRRYPDRQAMGTLTFDVVSLKKRSSRVYSLIGKYFLQREGLENLEGYFLLILQKIKGKWKIVADSTH